jgi:hypothetical protein
VFFFGAANASRLDPSHINSTKKVKGEQKTISHTEWELHTCEHEQEHYGPSVYCCMEDGETGQGRDSEKDGR